jgi:coenzyme F420-dependent glucose-6-phosphate dehydrogenase
VTSLTAFALNCTLKPSPAPSSTDRMLSLVIDELSDHDVKTRSVRLADYEVRPGVTSDEGGGDQWPELRSAILDADLFILGTPIWLGHPSSHAQRAMERLDAFLGETDDRGRMISADRVAMIAVVGNEDGAHHVGADLFQGLNDVGFTLAFGAMTYWVGEAMHQTDFDDLETVPDKVMTTTKTMVQRGASRNRAPPVAVPRVMSTTAFGYTLPSEEHGPRTLVDNAVRAEGAGFDFCSISDHFHPWVQAQGHSPFVWSVLGAVANATQDLDVAVGVSCPLVRIHPAVIAQAAATTGLLFEGRFSLGVGSGEALNEHILGHRWPTPELRLAMLEEAVTIIRRLWSGETVDHHGEIYSVENARLFDPPAQPIPIVVSGFGRAAAELAAELGDGYWGHSPDGPDLYERAGGTGPRYAQINVCLGPDEAQCRKTVHDVWPNSAIPGQLAQDLPTWTHFEQAATLVTEDDAVAGVPCGPDVDGAAREARKYLDTGFDHVYFHQIGPDQDSFFDLWERELRDALRDR